MKRSAGFTIIEVMLFLGISGTLAVALLVGTGAALQRQQYRDSVQSFASFIRGEYARVLSVENHERNELVACPLSGSGSAVPRGQSNCLIVGRYLRTDDGAAGGGAQFQTFPLYAMQDGGNWRYTLGESDRDYRVEWSAKTRLSSHAGTPAPISILMYRDPDLGTITTKSTRTLYTASNIASFVADSTPASMQEICLYDRGWMVNERLSVFLGARAGSADAIRVGPAEAEGCINA